MCMHIAKSENGLCILSKSLNSVHSLDRLERSSDPYCAPGDHMIEGARKVNAWFPSHAIPLSNIEPHFQYLFS